MGNYGIFLNPFPKQALAFTCLQYRSFENIVGKREIARYQQFLLFPQCFLSIWRTFRHFYHNRNCRQQTLSIWKSLKFVVWERVEYYYKRNLRLVPKPKQHCYFIDYLYLFLMYKMLRFLNTTNRKKKCFYILV